MRRISKARFKSTAPVEVNLNACDGCGTCAELCPMGVFQMVSISEEERRQLSLPGKLKVRIKGNTKALALYTDACIACGKCATMCHERAIKVDKTKQGAYA